jgi:hypothetical protein
MRFVPANTQSFALFFIFPKITEGVANSLSHSKSPKM